MESEKFAIVLIVLIVIVVGFAGGLFYFFVSPMNSEIPIDLDAINNGDMKNKTLGDVKISVPENSTFKLSDDSSESNVPRFYDSDIGIYIMVYGEYMTKKDIDSTIQEYVENNKCREIKLKGLSENVKAYKNPYDETVIVVVNGEGNKAVFLTIPYSDEIAVKMANSVIFM